MARRQGWRLRITRDLVIFVVGLAGIIHETLVQAGERPTLLILFAAMIGLPVFLRTDEGALRTRAEDGGGDQDGGDAAPEEPG